MERSRLTTFSIHTIEAFLVYWKPNGWLIVLIEQGIGEQGTHEELLARNGTYANLYNMQLRI